MCTKVNSIEKFFEQLPGLSDKMSGNIYYRGQGAISYALTPSVFRDSLLDKESENYSKNIDRVRTWVWTTNVS